MQYPDLHQDSASAVLSSSNPLADIRTGPKNYFEMQPLGNASSVTPGIVFNSGFYQITWTKKGAEQAGHLAPGSQVRGYRISFSQEFLLMADAFGYHPFFDSIAEHHTHLPVVEMHEEIAGKMEEVVEAMAREYASGLSFRSDILKGLLKILIVYFSRRMQVAEQPCSPDCDADFFKKFTGLLEKNFVSKKNVADYADALRVSPGYLSEIVKKVSGHTASHHIQQRIILEAKRAAICSGQSMKEIAYTLGFLDIAHFSKFFKNKCGVNFSDFKRGIA